MELNLAKIFMREEPVAGLAIRENGLQLILLEQDAKTPELVRKPSSPTPPKLPLPVLRSPSATSEGEGGRLRRPGVATSGNFRANGVQPDEEIPGGIPRRDGRRGAENSQMFAGYGVSGQAPAKKVAFFVEEPLSEGVIVNGEVRDIAAFGAALQKLAKKCPQKVRYTVASIPPNQVYARVFSFPKTIRGQKLEASLKLTIGFQLPFKPEEVYLDWEKVEPEIDENEVFLAAAPQSVINPYVEALNAAGFNPVAVEFHPLSFARTVTFPATGAALVEFPTASSLSLSIIERGVLRFNRSVPTTFVSLEQRADEKRRTIDFYEAERGKIQVSFSDLDAELSSDYGEPRLRKAKGAWAVALGAALRGIAPRSTDTTVSLMPVGTEEAYEYHKAIIFSQFAANLVVGISIFFSAAFVAALLFMSSLRAETSRQLDRASSLPISTDAIELEERARNINDMVRSFARTQKDIPWASLIIKEIRPLAGSGITVTGFSMSSIRGAFSMSGIAKRRADLDAFKLSLSKSPFLADAGFAATNLTQLADIPFSASFRIANPDALYDIN